MNKLLILVLSVAFVDFARAEMSYEAFSADVKNVCKHPIKMVVPKTKRTDEIKEIVNTGDSIDVLGRLICTASRGIFTIRAFVSAIDELDRCLPSDYSFNISSVDGEISLNKERFFDVLKHAKLSKGSGYTYFQWTISDASLCP